MVLLSFFPTIFTSFLFYDRSRWLKQHWVFEKAFPYTCRPTLLGLCLRDMAGGPLYYQPRDGTGMKSDPHAQPQCFMFRPSQASAGPQTLDPPLLTPSLPGTLCAHPTCH